MILLGEGEREGRRELTRELYETQPLSALPRGTRLSHLPTPPTLPDTANHRGEDLDTVGAHFPVCCVGSAGHGVCMLE